MANKISPIYINDGETGTKYELDFNKESIAYAKRTNFDIDEVTKYPAVTVPELFYIAFRMHHKSIAREKTDRIFAAMGGLDGKALARLVALYQQAALVGTFRDDDEAPAKNARYSMEILEDDGED